MKIKASVRKSRRKSPMAPELRLSFSLGIGHSMTTTIKTTPLISIHHCVSSPYSSSHIWTKNLFFFGGGGGRRGHRVHYDRYPFHLRRALPEKEDESHDDSSAQGFLVSCEHYGEHDTEGRCKGQSHLYRTDRRCSGCEEDCTRFSGSIFTGSLGKGEAEMSTNSFQNLK